MKTLAGESTLSSTDTEQSQTQENQPFDWLLPEIETQIGDGLEDADQTFPRGPSNDSASTDRIAEPKISKPVRKADNVFRLGDSHSKLIQQWECLVLHVDGECVACEMCDLTDESKAAEFSEVYLSEFSPFDKDLLQEGAVFYWSIGHETSRSGQVRKFSEFRVRRVPPISKLRKREIDREAKKIHDSISKT